MYYIIKHNSINKIKNARKNPEKYGLEYKRYGEFDDIEKYSNEDIFLMLIGAYVKRGFLRVDGNYFINVKNVVSSGCTLIDVEFNKKNITTIAGKQNIRQDCNIREQISMPEVGSNKIYCANTKPIINDTKVMNGKILYSGELSIEFLYEVSNGMEAKRINLPFNFEAQSDLIEANNNVDTDLTVEQDNFVIVSDGNVEANITMQFNIGISKTEKISIIDDLEVKECRQNNIYSMIIYFVKPGDTLWKIAKKFRSTVEDIARVNGIEDENKIYVGQQLYIPKYIKKRIAV